MSENRLADDGLTFRIEFKMDRKKRTSVLCLRLTSQERTHCEEQASSSGLTVSDWARVRLCRHPGQGQRFRANRDRRLTQIERELARANIYLCQIAREVSRAEQGSAVPLMSLLASIETELGLIRRDACTSSS